MPISDEMKNNWMRLLDEACEGMTVVEIIKYPPADNADQKQTQTKPVRKTTKSRAGLTL